MARITALAQADPVQGNESVPIVQNGKTRQISVALLNDAASIRAEAARDAAIAFLNPFASQAAGEAATSEGEVFNFLDGNNQIALAKRTASGSDILATYFGVDRVAGAGRTASTRAQLKASSDMAAPVLLTEANRRGNWAFVLGDFTAQIAADPYEGVYAKADGIGAAVGAWVRVYDGPANALWFGITNNNTPCQAQMTALMTNPFIKSIRFPAGIYQAYLNNSISGRTFFMDEGAIIDGTVHIAVGTGPDTHSVPAITWVDDTRVIGTVTSTVRVGSYYCRGLNIDKVAITEVNPAYVNQTVEGGTFGVHIYCGSKDVLCGEILCKSATAGTYALGVDRGPTNDADHRPENIRVKRLTVRQNTQAIVSTNNTVNFTLDEVIADSWDTYAAMILTADENLWIKKFRAIGAPSTPNKDGIYVLNGISAKFGEVEISGSTQIGFRTFNCGRVDAEVIRSYGHALDQVRIESPGTIGKIETSDGGTGVGVLIQGNASGLEVESVNDNGGGGVTVTAADVVTNSVISKGNLAAGKYGLNLNGANRFVNKFLLTDGNAQGLRMTNVNDPTFGVMRISNSTNGIVGSNVTGVAYDTLTFSGNGTDSNITLNTTPGFRGSLLRASVALLGDANVTLTVGTSAVSQVCATALTAARTITLATTGARNGDKFRITRTAASAGAFALNVASITGLGTVVLSTGQWLEVEFSGSWHMTAKGSLA